MFPKLRQWTLGATVDLGVCFLCLIFFWFYVYLSIVFSAYYHWWICLLLWLLSTFIYIYIFSFFSFCECVCVCFFVWFCLYSFAFTICPRVLSLCFCFLVCFSFSISSFLLSYVAGRVLVHQPGVGPETPRWESRIQDIGPPETSQLNIISTGGSSPEIFVSTLRPSSTQQPARSSAGHHMQNN